MQNTVAGILIEILLIISILSCVCSFYNSKENNNGSHLSEKETVSNIEPKYFFSSKTDSIEKLVKSGEAEFNKKPNLKETAIRRLLHVNSTTTLKPNPCQHGGTGVIGNKTIVCLCPDHYGGYHCEYRTDVCQVYGCVNGKSTCRTLSGGGFSCREARISCCDRNICPEDWHCVPNDNDHGYSCEFGSKDNTDYCQNDSKNACSNNICQNGGQCHGSSCRCLLPFTGTYCELLINYCTSDPCPFGVKCESKFGGYACQCPQNLMGIHCNILTRHGAEHLEDLGLLYNNVQHVGVDSVYCLYANALGSLPHILVTLGDSKQIVIKRNDFISLNSSGENVMNSCPSELQAPTKPKYVRIFQHSFKESGVQNISVVVKTQGYLTAKHAYSAHVEHMLQCNMSAVLYHCATSTEKPTPYTRRSHIVIMVHTELNCPQFHLLRTWSLYRIYHNEETKNNVSLSLVHSITNLNSYLVIPSFTLHTGEYFVNLTAHMTIDEKNTSSHAYTQFDVKEVPLRAIILGGLLVYQNSRNSIEIDASESYDPNFPREQQTPLSFIWYCSLFKWKQLAQKGKYMCDGFDEQQLNATGSKLNLPAGSLMPNATVLFKVFVSKASHVSAVTQQYVKIVNEDTPLLRIRCHHNCDEDRLDPNKVTSIEAYCISCKNTTNEIIDFKWTVEPGIEPLSTEFGLENPLLLVHENSFESDREYNLIFRAFYASSLHKGGIFNRDIIGRVETKVITNSPPHFGYCVPNPKDGFAITTHFTIDCHHFQDSDTLVTYEVSHFRSFEVRGIFVGYDISSHIEDIILVAGMVENDYLTSLKIYVTDSLGAYSHYDYNVTVKPFLFHVPDPYQVLLGIKSMGSGSQSHLALMSAAGNTRNVVQTVMSLAISYSDLMGREELATITDKDTANQSRHEVREMLLKYLHKEPILTISGCKHTTTALEKVLSATDGLYSSLSTRQAIELLYKITDFLHDSYFKEKRRESEAQEIGASIVTIISSLLSTLGERNDEKFHSTDKEVLRLRENLTRKIFDALDHCAKFLLFMKAYEVQSATVKYQDIVLIYKRSNLFNLQNDINVHSTIEFNDANSIALERLNFYMVRFDKNPFNWHYSSQKILPPVLLPNLRYENGTPVTTGAKISFNMKLPTNLKARATWTHVQMRSRLNKTDTTTNIMKIVVPTSGKLVVLARGSDNIGKTRVSMKRNVQPRMEDLWTEAVTVPNDNTHIFGDQTDVVRIANVAAYKGEVFFIGIIPLEDIKHRQSEKNQSRFPRKADNLGESNSALHTEPSNEEDNATLPLEFVAYTVQCLSWNEEKGWKPDCEALIFAENITCSCPSINRITSISYSNVPIDTIDLRSYARADGVEQDDNYVIAFLVMMLLAAFLALSAWGHQWDCGDEPRFGLTSLPDNKPEHRHEYLVAVYTGRMPGSGTTSSLAMQLQGALGASDVHVLDGVWRDILRTGGRDWFSLRTAAPLGELQQLRLFHGHAGARPTWYCDRVMVLEPSPPPIPAAPRCYFFLVRRWFSPATAGCSVPRAPSRRLHALLPRFSRALERQFDNGYHSWFGMFHSHPESNFTRYQRICAAMMQLSLFLIVSMEMQKLLVNDDPTSSAGSYGNYALQWTDIFGGFVAAVFTFVAHCILAELYRRTASGNRHRFSTIVYQELGQSAASPTASPDYVTFRRLPSGTGNPAETREEATSLSTSVTTKDYSFPIPYKFLYLWWSITYAVITICFFVATSNSVTYSWVASLKLLTSFFVSFIISVFVLEPIRLLTVSIFCTFWDRNIRIDDRRYFPKEMTWKEKKAAETSKSSSVNVTLSLVKLKLLHRNNKMEIKFLRFLSEFFLYVAVIVMILIMVDQIEEYKPHTRIGSTTPEFRNIPKSYTRNEQISSQGQFMEYIQGTLLPEMYGTAGVGSLFGVPRLKQIRSDRCVAIYYNNLNLGYRCLDDYKVIAGDTKDYVPTWTQVRHWRSKRQSPADSTDSEWRYQAMELPHISGNLSWYQSGGYIAHLKRNYDETSVALRSLLAAEWIDSMTMAVFAEYSQYIPNRESVFMVRLMGERIASGGYATHLKTDIFKLHLQNSTSEIFFTATLFMLAILLGAILCIEVHQISSSRSYSYVKGTWNIISLGLIGIGAIVIALCIHRSVLFEEDTRQSTSYELERYFNFYPAIDIDKLILGLLTIMLVVIILKGWQILSSWTQFRTIASVLCASTLTLSSFAMLLWIVLAAFATFGYFIAFSHSISFRNPVRAFITSLHLLMGYFTLNTVTVIPLGYIYFILGLIFLTLLFSWGFKVLIIKKYYTFQKNVPLPETKEMVFGKAVEYLFSEVKHDKLQLLSNSSRALYTLEQHIKSHFGRSASIGDFIRLQKNLTTVKIVVATENFDKQIAELAKKLK